MTEPLKEQIERLQALHERLARVRQVPPALLQMRKGGAGVGAAFGVLKEIGEVVMSEPVQSALHQARESLERDGASGIGTEVRRQNRKRR